MYESDYGIAEVFNSIFSGICVALDEDLSTVDENPLNYLPINKDMSLFLKPNVLDKFSKIIRALKSTKQNVNAISTRYFVKYQHYFVII